MPKHLIAIFFALTLPAVSKAQSVARTDTETRQKFTLAISGGGGFTTDATEFDSKKIHGQLAAELNFPNQLSLSLSFNATNKLGNIVQANDTNTFGAQIVNQDLGPYSFGLNFKGARLIEDLWGFYSYFQLSTVTWTLAAEDLIPDATAPSYKATLPYS